MIHIVRKPFDADVKVYKTLLPLSHLYARMLRIAAVSRSARDLYCMRTVSVMCLWISAAIRSPILKVISCLTYAAVPRMLRIMSVRTDSVLCPYCLRRHPFSVRGVRILTVLHPSISAHSAAIRGKFGTICLIFCRQFMHELLILAIHWSSEQPMSDPLRSLSSGSSSCIPSPSLLFSSSS